MTTPAAAPRTVAFTLSYGCPLRCRHCLVAARADQGLSRRVFAERELSDAILSLDPSRYDTVLFTGGEPTLHPRLLAAGIESCRRRGLRSVVTSAPIWARTPALARRALERTPRFDVLILSYDSYHLEYLSPAHYEAALTAGQDRGISVGLNLSYADEADRDHLLQAILPLQGRLCGVNAQAIVPLSNEILDRGVRVAATQVCSLEDLDRLPRSCSAGDVIVNFDLQVDFCCWSGSVDESPFRSACGSGKELNATLTRFRESPPFDGFLRQGLLGLLSLEARQEVVRVARDRSFVNECHLCTFLMNRANRPAWEACVGQRLPAPAPSA